MKIQLPISVGEFVDRLTILKLKYEHVPEGDLKNEIQKQINQLDAAAVPIAYALRLLEPLCQDLAAINAQLWAVEDDLRVKEQQKHFDKDFITLARSVYRLNDQRAALKKQIDQRVGSDFSDVKIYRSETRGS